MSFGLFPSAIASLWHALFNLRRYLVLGFASRLLAMVVSLPLIMWLVHSHESVGEQDWRFPLPHYFRFVLFSFEFCFQ